MAGSSSERHETDDPETFTVEEAARKLNIGRSLAYQLARSGELPTLRLGHRIVVPKVQLEALLRGGRQVADMRALGREGVTPAA